MAKECHTENKTERDVASMLTLTNSTGLTHCCNNSNINSTWNR